MYEFRGWDWWELVECWNLAPEDDEEWGHDDEEAQDAIMTFLWSHYDNKTFDEVKPDLYRFIEALAYHDDLYSPVWRALLRIKDDYVLLQFISVLLPMMWS